MSQLLLRDPAIDYPQPTATLLGQTAAELHAMNYHRAACVIARQAIEATTAAICTARHCHPRGLNNKRPKDWRVGVSPFITTLRNLDYLTRAQSDAIRTAIRNGDLAAHGYAIDQSRVEMMLSTMQEMLALI